MENDMQRQGLDEKTDKLLEQFAQKIDGDGVDLASTILVVKIVDEVVIEVDRGTNEEVLQMQHVGQDVYYLERRDMDGESNYVASTVEVNE